MTQNTLASGATPIATIFATGMTVVNRIRSGINGRVEKLGNGGIWMEKIDLILRATALDAISTDGGCGMCVRRVLDIPAVGAAPVVHARWQGLSPFVDTEECSNCGYNIQSEELETPYCPWCGAKMDGERRNDDETSDD